MSTLVAVGTIAGAAWFALGVWRGYRAGWFERAPMQPGEVEYAERYDAVCREHGFDPADVRAVVGGPPMLPVREAAPAAPAEQVAPVVKVDPAWVLTLPPKWVDPRAEDPSPAGHRLRGSVWLS